MDNYLTTIIFIILIIIFNLIDNRFFTFIGATNQGSLIFEPILYYPMFFLNAVYYLILLPTFLLNKYSVQSIFCIIIILLVLQQLLVQLALKFNNVFSITDEIETEIRRIIIPYSIRINLKDISSFCIILYLWKNVNNFIHIGKKISIIIGYLILLILNTLIYFNLISKGI